MSTSMSNIGLQRSLVRAGQLIVRRDFDCIEAVVGSCVGLVIYSEADRIAAFAHIVLPQSDGRRGPQAKFADKAVVRMVRALRREGVDRYDLVAKLAGAAVPRDNDPQRSAVGPKLVTAIKRELHRLSVPLAASEVGGHRGRRLFFDCATCQLGTRTVGSEMVWM